MLASDGHSSGAGLGRGIHFSSYVNFTLTSIRAEVVSVTRLSAAHSSHTYSAPIMSPRADNPGDNEDDDVHCSGQFTMESRQALRVVRHRHRDDAVILKLLNGDTQQSARV